MNLINVDGWGADEQEDIKYAIKALINQCIAEKGKIGITWMNFGGYNYWFQITIALSEFVNTIVKKVIKVMIFTRYFGLNTKFGAKTSNVMDIKTIT